MDKDEKRDLAIGFTATVVAGIITMYIFYGYIARAAATQAINQYYGFTGSLQITEQQDTLNTLHQQNILNLQNWKPLNL